MSALTPEIAADLVRRIADGDDGAEGELIERSGGTLRFLARRFTRSEADAEDLYQDTLMLALTKIRRGEVQQPERLAGFLRSLVKNLSTQQYRRRRYQAETSLEQRLDFEDAAAASPLDGLLHQERSSLTRRVLSELGVPRDREVLFRYYLTGESSSRICADLEIEGDHFYRVLSRARQRYRRLWEEARAE
ncbi:MAG: sigma-70 family RNA polymerase sigma factor [Acidobacteriota bacterium]|nr:sigma-70 family RNA polymerase sigma factor [Acidobacteriota bacterium]